jgi:hypothetical protein
MQRRGIMLLAELPFDDTVVRECPGLRVAQCLPGPGQDAGIVARDLERQVLEPGTLGVVVRVATPPATEQGAEVLLTPIV